jgi:hypothetical protein
MLTIQWGSEIQTSEYPNHLIFGQINGRKSNGLTIQYPDNLYNGLCCCSITGPEIIWFRAVQLSFSFYHSLSRPIIKRHRAIWNFIVAHFLSHLVRIQMPGSSWKWSFKNWTCSVFGSPLYFIFLSFTVQAHGSPITNPRSGSSVSGPSPKPAVRQ